MSAVGAACVGTQSRIAGHTLNTLMTHTRTRVLEPASPAAAASGSEAAPAASARAQQLQGTHGWHDCCSPCTTTSRSKPGNDPFETPMITRVVLPLVRASLSNTLSPVRTIRSTCLQVFKFGALS